MGRVTKPQRICAIGFSDADRASLACLLRLLEPRLSQAWEVVEHPSRADLCLVRLDGEGIPAISHHRVVGCAHRPQLWPPGTLHRPLRATQLLALLSEQTVAADEPDSDPHAAHLRRQPLRLLEWPLELDELSALQLDVLAALSAGPWTLDALAIRVNASISDVAEVLGGLRAKGVLQADVMPEVATPVADHPPARKASPAAAIPGWRVFMAGLGQRLGLIAP